MRAVAAVAALGLALVGVPRAEEPPGAGRTLYRRLCASCHGHSGRGDGPVSGALGQRPTDLTRLAAANGGIFPYVGVVAAIDGTTTDRAHGVTEMPVWGEVLVPGPDAPVAEQARARGTIILITEHLRSIQQP